MHGKQERVQNRRAKKGEKGVFIGTPEVAQLRCGPTSETFLDSNKVARSTFVQ